jgi:hypothetical protein
VTPRRDSCEVNTLAFIAGSLLKACYNKDKKRETEVAISVECTPDFDLYKRTLTAKAARKLCVGLLSH